MTAGRPGAVAAAEPVFRTFAGLIVHPGRAGAAETAKLINNSLMAANLGLAHSAMMIGIQCGLDRQALAELLTAGSGGSYALEVYTQQRHQVLHARCSAAGKVHLPGQEVGEGDSCFRLLREAAAAVVQS